SSAVPDRTLFATIHCRGIDRTDFAQAGSKGMTSLGRHAAAADDSEDRWLTVTLRVNGENRDLRIDPRMTLLDCVRDVLHLTGTKKGCDHGQCGACTVHIDGRRANSCLALAAAYAGSEIVTIEGLGSPQRLHPMQAAFLEHDAYQCGYC